MDIDHIQSGAPSLKSATDQKKKEWAEEHAKRLQGFTARALVGGRSE